MKVRKQKSQTLLAIKAKHIYAIISFIAVKPFSEISLDEELSVFLIKHSTQEKPVSNRLSFGFLWFYFSKCPLSRGTITGAQLGISEMGLGLMKFLLFDIQFPSCNSSSSIICSELRIVLSLTMLG